MSKKAILVLDEVPGRCVECPCFGNWLRHCNVTNKKVTASNIDVKKPDWCPIQESLVGHYEGEPIERFQANEPTRDLKRLRGMIASLPDDGTVMIQITRNYPDRSNHDNALVKGFMKMGKVVLLQCETTV